ncbi:MAG: DUF4105 domain-containing protein [Bacteroidales bacterium]|nr:DUF4105 domain-containing protein [Bacteroidales bacterium]
MKKIVVGLFLLLVSSSIWASPTLSEQAHISLLTYSRTNEVHAMYGHTAVRVKDPVNGFDMIFNYGMFDFSSDDFVYRFVKGETDYILGISNFEYLTIECYMRNMSVEEQIYNLTPKEKQRVFDFLMTNAEPQNRVYRYNFLYDNCATRPRIVIENNVDGKVVYKDSIPTKTFRELIHDCTIGNAWLRFGIDLVLGSPLDQKTTYLEQMFLPKYMEDGYSRAVIIDSAGVVRNLVSPAIQIIPQQTPTDVSENAYTSPTVVGLLVMIFLFAISFLGYKQGRFFWNIDFVLFLIFGLAGLLVFFMTFFSTHPATHPNYLLFVLHPVHLLFAFTLLFPTLRQKITYYHLLNTAVLALFLVLVRFLPQQFPTAMIYLTFALFFRSLFQTLRLLKRN